MLGKKQMNPLQNKEPKIETSISLGRSLAIRRSAGSTDRLLVDGQYERIANYSVEVIANVVTNDGATTRHDVELAVICNGERLTTAIPITSIELGKYLEDLFGIRAYTLPASGARAAIAADIRAQASDGPYPACVHPTRLAWHVLCPRGGHHLYFPSWRRDR